ncbi:MAG: CDP-alcohol phosphatidyltransferase family protein [Clostridia bacterium]|nr:CDP-alcohol phosphatidyltransferase family protein [Clostridia bacterium]
MNRLLKKDQIFTLPNLLSIIRLLLIPVIVYLYFFEKQYVAAVAIILISGLTDIVDGIIARSFNMVSDFGKILDPIADKLTQITVIFCIATRIPAVWLLVGMFIIKEIVMLVMGMVAIKKLDSVNSAKWYGKANTVILYAAMVLFIIFPKMDNVISSAIVIVCAVSLVLSLGLYIRFYHRLFINSAAENSKQTADSLNN